MARDEVIAVIEEIRELRKELTEHRTQSYDHWECTKDFIKEANDKLDKLDPIIEMLLVLGGGRKFAVWLAPLAIFGVISGGLWIGVKKLLTW